MMEVEANDSEPKFDYGQEVMHFQKKGRVVVKHWDGTGWLYDIMLENTSLSTLIPENELSETVNL